ncbi:phospholipase D-like domain-containing protein [Nocardia pseudovaccinii]|uniref:phospholipase D-like domain-containing protein n=1 Tax=Nocardia pseudovaccinii TaxID=189540 RepID=UPI0007A46783|nr:phospholipase D-like domain-containing protein [Nocardia pseudovaccinii]
MKVSVCHNGDDVFISWKPPGPIDDCRGFALRRRRNGADEVVKTWVGFAGQKHKEGERRDSTQWPIQRFQWTDYMADPGDRVAYQVVPMVGPDKDHLSTAEDLASEWTDEFTLDHQVSPHIDAYFNRGIVAAQWVSRRLHLTDDDPRTKSAATKKLETVIDTPDDPFRNYLTGPLGARLFELLAAAADDGRGVFAALYELDDEQLESALEKLGKNSHIVLANGSVKKKGEDQNAAARERLKDIVDLHDRMVSPRALGHNKFLVICDENNQPRWTWTGSQNWTKTGLCTQANNSVLIDDPRFAGEYRKQWDRLEDAEAVTPDTLKRSNSEPRKRTIAPAEVTLWFTPTIGQVDLAEAREAIDKAERAILFLMFNPGPRDTLLNHIIDVARKARTAQRLYIKGAINQDPSVQNVKVPVFAQDNVVNADFDVVLPAAIDKPTSWFVEELKKLPTARAMVHSKVVLIDPFGASPVVMTGSHNLGTKASGTNDENFLIVRDAPGLASAYATNIMAVYNQYRWRFNRINKVSSTSWDGLKDNEFWQPWLWSGEKFQAIKDVKLREMDFWVGD